MKKNYSFAQDKKVYLSTALVLTGLNAISLLIIGQSF